MMALGAYGATYGTVDSLFITPIIIIFAHYFSSAVLLILDSLLFICRALSGWLSCIIYDFHMSASCPFLFCSQQIRLIGRCCSSLIANSGSGCCRHHH